MCSAVRDVSRGAAATVQFPGARINLNLGDEPPGKGGTVGSVINHVGFIVNDVQARVAEWKAAGVPVIAVAFGYSALPVETLGADCVIDHFDELYGAVGEVRARRPSLTSEAAAP